MKKDGAAEAAEAGYRIKNNPPDRKPCVAALTFVNQLFDTKCFKRAALAYFNSFFGLFFVAIPWGNLFLSFRAGEMLFFLFCKKNNRGGNECLRVIFPRLPVEIGIRLS